MEAYVVTLGPCGCGQPHEMHNVRPIIVMDKKMATQWLDDIERAVPSRGGFQIFIVETPDYD